MTGLTLMVARKQRISSVTERIRSVNRMNGELERAMRVGRQDHSVPDRVIRRRMADWRYRRRGPRSRQALGLPCPVTASRHDGTTASKATLHDPRPTFSHRGRLEEGALARQRWP